MEPQNQIDNWRSDISEPKDTLKIRDGDTVMGFFNDEGVKKESVDYGTSIAFAFLVDGEMNVKTWYVASNNYSLLGQIKALGVLNNTHVQITRLGAKKSDTRYSIKKA